MAVDPEAVKRLTALVMAKMGASGPTDLVVKLGLTADVPNAPRLAMNWLSGVNAPRADYLMTMLGKAGLLTDEADRAWRGLPPLTASEAAREAAAAAREAERLRERAEPEARVRRRRRTA